MTANVNYPIYIIFFLSWSIVAQNYIHKDISNIPDDEQKKFLIINKDSSWVNEVELDEVLILPKLKFRNRDDFRDYLILKRKTKKVWPYAKLASERFETLNKRLDAIDSKRGKRKYTKMIQRYVEDEFTEELKKLTKTEGQILIKLIHRQTGITTFDLVKDLRSGWNAFWYNTTANFFDISLKKTYDPFEVKEDFYIEDILRRAFQSGNLKEKSPKFAIDPLQLMKKWQKDSVTSPSSSWRRYRTK